MYIYFLLFHSLINLLIRLSYTHIWMKVRFINFERTKLPEEILRHNLDEKRKYFADISLEVEKSDAEVQVNIFASTLLIPLIFL